MAVNTPPTPIEDATSVLKPQDVAVQVAYVDQQNLDGYDSIVRHAAKRKAVFDRKVLGSKEGEVTYKVGDLVQVYRSDMTHTVSTEKKLVLMWSATPYRVRERVVNSYVLETMEGLEVAGRFSSRRLRRLVPKMGSELERVQRVFVEEGKFAGSEVVSDEDVAVSLRGPHAVGDPAGDSDVDRAV